MPGGAERLQVAALSQPDAVAQASKGRLVVDTCPRLAHANPLHGIDTCAQIIQGKLCRLRIRTEVTGEVRHHFANLPDSTLLVAKWHLVPRKVRLTVRSLTESAVDRIVGGLALCLLGKLRVVASMSPCLNASSCVASI